ncbi:hypothetical protein BD310DRAFT_936668 [Dichomitus squalens]|uniref:Uncharacterized protein n=1 Tax=Dichomitus squalens TaxID=114155 RepID=A0A4Q9PJ43_9APHY|nr:hypothetical protein BD310DRAFT_936668 [Dichomitus squalens]
MPRNMELSSLKLGMDMCFDSPPPSPLSGFSENTRTMWSALKPCGSGRSERQMFSYAACVMMVNVSSRTARFPSVLSIDSNGSTTWMPQTLSSSDSGRMSSMTPSSILMKAISLSCSQMHSLGMVPMRPSTYKTPSSPEHSTRSGHMRDEGVCFVLFCRRISSIRGIRKECGIRDTSRGWLGMSWKCKRLGNAFAKVAMLMSSGQLW